MKKIIIHAGVILLASCFVASCSNSPQSNNSSSEGSQTVYSASTSSTRTLGTDIDHGAGSVDWSGVKSTGTNWVYCKVSGGYSNTGWNFQDPMFAKYWQQLPAKGITRGAYCFFDLTEDGLTQAKLYLKLVNAAGGFKENDLPPCLDIEWTPSPDDKNAPLPPNASWQGEALAWLKYVEKQTGRIPVIYTGLSMAQNNFDERFAKYPLWVARYPSNNSTSPTKNPYPGYAPSSVGPWKTWAIWQYSQTGNLTGIGPGQDLDIMKGSVKEFVKETTVK